MHYLRFIEINGNDRRVQALDKDLHIIGHSGDIKPQLCNGRISRRHATIVHNRNNSSWTITDGVGDRKSSNGIWRGSSLGERIEGSIDIAEVGDRVYLLPGDVLCAYVEVIRADEPSRETDSLDMAGQLHALRSTVEHVIDRSESAAQLAQTNQGRLDEIDGKIDSALDAIERVGSNPWKFFIGGVVIGGLVLSGIFIFGIYKNLDRMFDTYLHDREAIQKNK